MYSIGRNPHAHTTTIIKRNIPNATNTGAPAPWSCCSPRGSSTRATPTTPPRPPPPTRPLVCMLDFSLVTVLLYMWREYIHPPPPPIPNHNTHVPAHTPTTTAVASSVASVASSLLSPVLGGNKGGQSGGAAAGEDALDNAVAKEVRVCVHGCAAAVQPPTSVFSHTHIYVYTITKQ